MKSDYQKTQTELIAELDELRKKVRILEKLSSTKGGKKMDATEEQINLQDILESEKKYQTLFNNAGDAIFIHDLNGRFMEVNRIACDRLGYTREELLRLSPRDIDFPEYAAKVHARIEELKQKGAVQFESGHITRNGTPIPVEITARLIDYRGAPAIMSIARDISDRKQIESIVLMNEKKCSLLFDCINDGVLITDKEYQIEKANYKIVQLLDLPIEKIIHFSLPDFLSPESRNVFLNSKERTKNGKRPMVYKLMFLSVPRESFQANESPILDEKGVYHGSIIVLNLSGL